MSIVEATPAKQTRIKPPSDGRLWGKKDIAELFGIGISTVDLWRRDGRLPKGIKIGKTLRWDRRVIERIAGLDEVIGDATK